MRIDARGGEMAYNGKTQKTRQGKCIPCGGEIKWIRVDGRWTLFDKDATTKHVCAPKPGPEPEAKPEPAPEAPETPEPQLDKRQVKARWLDDDNLAGHIADIDTKLGLLQQDVDGLKNHSGGEYRFNALPPVGKIVKADGHSMMPELLRALAADQPAMLFGEPGTGKSEAVRVAARALGQPCTEITLGPADTPSRIIGYRNPTTDNYVETDFIKGWREGHVLLIDEVCIAAPAVLTILNPAFGGDGSTFSTPGGMLPRHPNTRLVIADNTNGLGQAASYPTRRALDISFRARFIFLEWSEDKALTKAITEQILRDRAEEAIALINEFRTAQKQDENMIPRTVTLRMLYAAARLMACDPRLNPTTAVKKAATR